MAPLDLWFSIFLCVLLSASKRWRQRGTQTQTGNACCRAVAALQLGQTPNHQGPNRNHVGEKRCQGKQPRHLNRRPAREFVLRLQSVTIPKKHIKKKQNENRGFSRGWFCNARGFDTPLRVVDSYKNKLAKGGKGGKTRNMMTITTESPKGAGSQHMYLATTLSLHDSPSALRHGAIARGATFRIVSWILFRVFQTINFRID